MSSEHSTPSQIEDLDSLRGINPTIIESRIRQYEQLGDHRTGLPGDDATTEWLASELSNLGIEPIVESYPFPLFEYKTAELSADDIHITGIPMFDGGVTGPQGVQGELADDSEDDLEDLENLNVQTIISRTNVAKEIVKMNLPVDNNGDVPFGVV